MKAARHLVCAVAELPACVQLGEHHLESRHVAVGVFVNGDAAAVIGNLHRSASVQRHVHLGGESCDGLVHGVVYDLPYEVHEALGTVAADVHGRALADGFEILERLDGPGVVSSAGVGRVTARVIRGRRASGVTAIGGAAATGRAVGSSAGPGACAQIGGRVRVGAWRQRQGHRLGSSGRLVGGCHGYHHLPGASAWMLRSLRCGER